MTQPSETGAQSPQSWAEQFKIARPIENLPNEAQVAFSDLLNHRAAIRDYYVLIPADRFDEGIGQGDSPKKELIHQVGNTRVRANTIPSQTLASWKYDQLQPYTAETLQRMDRDGLITELDMSTEELFDVLKSTDMHGKISLPYGKSSSTGDFLWGAVRHEVLHLGMAIKFGDYFGVPRPASVKQLYG